MPPSKATTPANADAPSSDARARILAAALDLFHARGVHAVGVDEVLARSGTGKSQLYHYFGSKDGLVAAVVVEFEARLARGEFSVPDRIESIADLERWFAVFVGFQRATGCVRHCPMATIASGLGPEQEPIRAHVERIFASSRAVLDRWFTTLRDRGALADGVDPVALADFCYAIMQGGLLVSRVRRDVTPFENAVEQALRHVRSVVRE